MAVKKTNRQYSLNRIVLNLKIKLFEFLLKLTSFVVEHVIGKLVRGEYFVRKTAAQAQSWPVTYVHMPLYLIAVV